MKYIIRVLKYILFLCLFLAIIVFVLQALGMTEDGFRNIFVPGSLWKVAAIIGAFAVAYPAVGFQTRHIQVPGAYEELRSDIIAVMETRGYVLKKEVPGEKMVFRSRSLGRRILRYFGEEAITLTKTAAGFDMEGHVRDITPVGSALEYRFSGSE